MDVSNTFNAFAGRYDATRRQLIGPFDSFYGTAIEALGLARRPITRVLDLGAGTGLFSAMVRDRYPAAEVTLLDGASAMLAQAKMKLAGPETAAAVAAGSAAYAPVTSSATAANEHGAGFSFIVADMTAPLPVGPWDAIVSSLAIHHLDDLQKRALYDRIYGALEPGGVFVNAEQVAGPTARLDACYLRRHELDARAAGAGDGDWQAALERMQLDRPATVEAQLEWLRASGFADVDCLFKDHRFAVLVALR